MTVQPADVEPETQRASTSDWRRDPNFRWPEKAPWSKIGAAMIDAWGRDERGREDPEHEEIIGPTGSGKTWLMCTQLQDRARLRKTGAVIICTKPADKTIHRLGWPITDDWRQVQQEPNVIFWPRTTRMGTARKDYHEAKITDLLHRLWRPEANTIVAFDEVGYVESLSRESRALVQQYWREGRSQGITVVAMKQRPQGALRDMHSETYWTAVFPPKDRSDTERFAELLGAKRDWVPVIDSLSRERREFVIRHARTEEAWVSWVDTPLEPAKPPKPTPAYMGGRSAGRG
jgi:nucleoside-triphosphatase THEP1